MKRLLLKVASASGQLPTASPASTTDAAAAAAASACRSFHAFSAPQPHLPSARPLAYVFLRPSGVDRPDLAMPAGSGLSAPLGGGRRTISTSLLTSMASPSAGSLGALEQQLEELQSSVRRLETTEAARFTLSRLLTLLDDARLNPQLITAEAVADMFTPAAVVDVGRLGSAENLPKILTLMHQLAQEGGPGRHHACNIVPQPSRNDPGLAKATAYLLVVEPLAGARPVVTSMWTLKSSLEKGLDDKWRIKSLSFVEVVGNT